MTTYSNRKEKEKKKKRKRKEKEKKKKRQEKEKKCQSNRVSVHHFQSLVSKEENSKNMSLKQKSIH